VREPPVLAASVALVAIAAAAPIVVYRAVRGVVAPATATWIAIAVGVAMLLLLAVAWVIARSRREAAAALRELRATSGSETPASTAPASTTAAGSTAPR
jgi:hypothetical protein